MTDFFLGLATGYLFTWPAIAILIVLGIVFESSKEHMLAAFFGIVAAVSAYFFFHLDLQSLTLYIAAYFGIGMIWSIWRYKRYSNEVVARNKSAGERSRADAARSLLPSRMLSKLTTWVIVWPFSMVENLAGDLINLVQTAITRVFKGIYNRIYEAAVGELLTVEERAGHSGL